MLRHFMAASVCVLMSVGGGVAMAAERMSCDELKAVTDALDYFADALTEADVTDIRGDNEADEALGEVTKGMEILAASEDHDALRKASSEMTRVWNTDGPWTAEQLSDFKMALDSAIMNMDRIHYSECD